MPDKPPIVVPLNCWPFAISYSPKNFNWDKEPGWEVVIFFEQEQLAKSDRKTKMIWFRMQ